MPKTLVRKTPPPQRRQPQQKRSSATVNALLEAATRVLREERTEAFNTNRIAQRAGISIGSLYEYFSGKRDVLVALARQLQAQDQAALRAALAAPGADPVAALVHALFARHSVDKDVRRAVMSAHIAEGHGLEQRDSVTSFVDVLATHPYFSRVTSLRLMVAVQAALGIARAITDGTFDAREEGSDALARETIALIRGLLAHDLPY